MRFLIRLLVFTFVFAALSFGLAAHGQTTAGTASHDEEEDLRKTVRELARDIGFDEVDGGPLMSARFTEPIGMMWGQLAFEAGYGERVAFRVLKNGR